MFHCGLIPFNHFVVYKLIDCFHFCRIENPFYMSVIMELDALGYPESSEYIQELNNIDYDRHEYENIVAPFLRNSRDVLKVLCIGLKKAENAKREGQWPWLTNIRTIKDHMEMIPAKLCRISSVCACNLVGAV